MQLNGKSVIITGAARGVGRACAVAFAAEGADVVLVDIAADLPGVGYPLGTAGQLEHTAEQCRFLGAAVLVAQADVRDPQGVARAVAAAVDRFGRVDVLVNNAGIAAPSGRPLHETTEEEWRLMLDVNLSGAYRFTKAVLPRMIASRRGSIINIASTAGLVGYRHFAGYVSAKHGLIGLTRACALDYAPYQIRVNALCPGSVRDDEVVEGRMLSEIARCLEVPVEEHEALFAEGQPMNRLIEPGDVASAAVWLASEASQRVTGTFVPVDGGFTAR